MCDTGLGRPWTIWSHGHLVRHCLVLFSPSNFCSASGAGDPAKRKGKKEKVPGELWYIGSEQEWSQLNWKEWSRRVGRVPGGIQWEADLHGESGSQ